MKPKAKRRRVRYHRCSKCGGPTQVERRGHETVTCAKCSGPFTPPIFGEDEADAAAAQASLL